jgi:hypothetical protein
LPLRYQEIDISELCVTDIYKTHEYTLNRLFVAFCQKKINGLLNQGVFQIVNITELPLTKRFYGSWFVDIIKQQDGALFEKSRLMVQAHYNSEKKQVLT